ncbi:hypothetical protein, partial [Sphingomonas sp.]
NLACCKENAGKTSTPERSSTHLGRPVSAPLGAAPKAVKALKTGARYDAAFGKLDLLIPTQLCCMT